MVRSCMAKKILCEMLCESYEIVEYVVEADVR